jgi:hypothetical protein
MAKCMEPSKWSGLYRQKVFIWKKCSFIDSNSSREDSDSEKEKAYIPSDGADGMRQKQKR